ncbi:uncharacterized protein Z518_04690 [Rhinocladiella mackenziei CBS 650.93]|uniref:Uncharacterized protein n=1 Tax=Rhinocladiella mackenziei CBS 650.93 TaxID=1442369 RepID=A0A0D2ILR8_9EURO|nr:uncharacterized protein Z518_04690 [Rhinocladiella mackenziei CBS 650.93]KIX06714.1 hypothetical protein Z518_04690 [Rhinocladiella mackenziei CBS 650.93]
MDSFPEHSPKQAGQAEPTIEEIKEWNADELFEWIQQGQSKQLKVTSLKNSKRQTFRGRFS